MAAVTHPLLRKALSFGTGVGIVIEGPDLRLAAVRVRPAGIDLLGTLVITGFRERPAAEWSKEYLKFATGLGVNRTGATVLLPRRDVVLRTIHLPGVSDEDAPNAIRFQLDSIHPFNEEDVCFDWKRVQRTGVFVVAVARRETVDQFAALFAEAGIPVGSFATGADAIHHAIRVLSDPPADFLGVLELHAGTPNGLWIYGESASAPMFAAEFDAEPARAFALAKSQMRQPPEVEPADLADVLPRWRSSPEAMDLSDAGRSRQALPYTAALTSAVPHLGAPANLLPAELRSGSSRVAYIPTAVLAVILLGMGVALLLQDRWLDRAYVRRLEGEIARLQPAVKKTEALDRASAQALQQIRELDAFRSTARQDLDLLLEFTRAIEPPASVGSLNVNRSTVTVMGEVEQAEALLKKLEVTPVVRNLEFAAPISRNPINQAEVYRLRGQREGGR